MDEPKSKRRNPEKKSKKKADKKKKHKKSSAKNKHGSSGNNGDREALPLQDPTPVSTSATAAAAAVTFEAGAASPLKKEQQPPGSHPFLVDDSDHCETLLQAYNDLEVVLDGLLWTDDYNNTSNGKIELRPRWSERDHGPNRESTIPIAATGASNPSWHR